MCVCVATAAAGGFVCCICCFGSLLSSVVGPVVFSMQLMMVVLKPPVVIHIPVPACWCESWQQLTRQVTLIPPATGPLLHTPVPTVVVVVDHSSGPPFQRSLKAAVAP